MAAEAFEIIGSPIIFSRIYIPNEICSIHTLDSIYIHVFFSSPSCVRISSEGGAAAHDGGNWCAVLSAMKMKMNEFSQRFKKAPDAFLAQALTPPPTLTEWALRKKPMRTIFHTSGDWDLVSRQVTETKQIPYKSDNEGSSGWWCCFSSRRIWIRTVCISTLKMFYLIIVIGRLRIHKRGRKELVEYGTGATLFSKGDLGCKERRKHLFKWTETERKSEWMDEGPPIQVYVNYTCI